MRGVARVALAAALSVATIPPAGASSPALFAEPCQQKLLASEQTPIRSGPCTGVRPGARVYMSTGGSCSFNFLFDAYREQDGRRILDGRYMGTAGHCVLLSDDSQETERTWTPGEGPTAEDSQRNLVGDFVYAALQPRPDFDPPRDFALIKLRDGVKADPQMCHFGGPTGVNQTVRPDGVHVLHHSGQGLGLGSTIPGRTAVAYGMPSPHFVLAAGAAIFGDSGSGIVDDQGRAVGVVVAVGVLLAGSTGAAHAGTVEITRLVPQVSRAEELLGIDLELRTAPLLPA